jgi:hypothetical protein
MILPCFLFLGGTLGELILGRLEGTCDEDGAPEEVFI